jgi:hypothetical protein
MYSPTYGQLKSDLQRELDLQDETFITSDEMLSYFNEAVDMIEAAIHTIYEDYFLTTEVLNLVNGTAQYNLPTDIYAQKIRRIIYSDGNSQVFDIKRVRELDEIPYLNLPGTQAILYKYMITNSSTAGLKINIYPTPNITTSNVTMYYIRNAKRFTADSDVCDIPEFTNVIVQYARFKCLSKEFPDAPPAQQAMQVLQMKQQEMVDTLTARVPDEDNEVIKDTRFYNDFDDWTLGGQY